MDVHDRSQRAPRYRSAGGAPRGQRGATLAGYALVLTVMVVAGLSSLKMLERDSEQFLIDSGSSIGEPPASRNAAVNANLTAPSGWVRIEPGQGGVVDTTPLFTSVPVGTHVAGLCLGLVSDQLTQVECTAATVQTITAARLPAGAIELRLPDGRCIGIASSTSPGTEVGPVTCGSNNASWGFNGSNPYVFQHTAATADRDQPICLDVADGAITPGQSMVIEECGSQASQQFGVA